MRQALSILLFLFCALSHSQTFEWAKQLDGAHLNLRNRLHSDPQGNIYLVCGLTSTNLSTPDFNHYDSKWTDSSFVIKYGPDGTYKWRKRYRRIDDFDCGGNRLYLISNAGIVITDLNGNPVNTISFGNITSLRAHPFGFFLTRGNLLERYDENGQLLLSKKFFGGLPLTLLGFDGNVLFLTAAFKCDTVVDGFSTGSGCATMGTTLSFLQCTGSGHVISLDRTISGGIKSSVSDRIVTDGPLHIVAITDAYESSEIYWFDTDQIQLHYMRLANQHFHIRRTESLQENHGSLYILSNDLHFGYDSTAMYLQKFNGQGQLIETGQGFVGLRGSHMLVNQYGVYVAGRVSHPLIAPTTLSVHPIDGSSFLGKLSISTTGISRAQIPRESQFYPNPAGTETSLHLNGLSPSDLQLKVYDLSGRPQKCPYSCGNNTVHLNVSELPAGIYICELSDGERLHSVGKIVVD